MHLYMITLLRNTALVLTKVKVLFIHGYIGGYTLPNG